MPLDGDSNHPSYWRLTRGTRTTTSSTVSLNGDSNHRKILTRDGKSNQRHVDEGSSRTLDPMYTFQHTFNAYWLISFNLSITFHIFFINHTRVILNTTHPINPLIKRIVVS